MAWVELKYSKKAVRKAGDRLSSKNIPSVRDLIESIQVLHNWRASHAYPIQSMLVYFRSKAYSVDPNAVVVQRLKRTPSILAKLTREHGMKLDRMEDVGGCRIVVANISQVYAVRDAIVEGRTRNTLRRQRDYIKKPKESGYRGIHLVYRYNGIKTAFKAHSVELQIRSKVQHAWATAVEVVGTFTGQALKASQGQNEWLEFFKLASIAFADIETRNLARNAKTPDRLELISYINKLNVIPRLRAFAVSTNHLGKDKKHRNDYFLLTLEIDKSNIQVRRYTPDEFDQATKDYAQKEKAFKNNSDKDVVLVAAESLHGLKKAYPNYFADTAEFSKNLERILETNEKSQKEET
ncbi:RelA/SpoT domain-containing protein [Methylophaga sp.]|uniref:RelA/SpoT domain-containing protein n=1 Tax=Methylophaga sp. TaxID=2024840 RepID=UPI0013FFC289|nr:RelA/SpoT domain-containing protein [Methylophaga sp.]MTI62919.1 (p)ppGpp synthetase [Methylophaga sp.]